MANILYDSFLNPVKFHQLDNVQPGNYVSRFMDDWAFRRTIQPWKQKVCFYQPWGTTDQVCLQYTSNFGGLILRMYDQDGLLVHTQAFTNMQQDELRPLFYIRQIQVNLNAFPPGKYFFTRDAAGAITYSEPFEILDLEDSGICIENPHPTLYLEYSHYEPTGGLKFFSPFAPKLRVPGIIEYKTPGSKDNVYEDQLLNQTMVNSVSFRVWQFILGGQYGVPPWFVDKVARTLSCSTWSADGRLYTKANEGSNFEPNAIDDYPMSGWSIDLREKLNRDSLVIENDVVIEGIAAAAIIVDNEGFGISGGPTSYQEIISLQ